MMLENSVYFKSDTKIYVTNFLNYHLSIMDENRNTGNFQMDYHYLNISKDIAYVFFVRERYL